MNEVRPDTRQQHRSQSKALIIESVEIARNLTLLNDYQAYLRVEKGIAALDLRGLRQRPEDLCRVHRGPPGRSVDGDAGGCVRLS
jgi:hypothetical protein